MTDLCTTVYRFRQPERLAEVRECFERNAALSQVDRIFVLAELVNGDEPGYEFLQHPKLTIVPIDSRPTYRDFFDLAREECVGRVVCAHNSDIYFDETIALTELVQRDELWCLTRHNVRPNESLKFYYLGGADAWVFRSPLKPFVGDDTLIGVVGCDGRIAQKASEAHIEIKNPSLSVISYHLHKSNERNDQPSGMSYSRDIDYRPLCVRPSALHESFVTRSKSVLKNPTEHSLRVPLRELSAALSVQSYEEREIIAITSLSPAPEREQIQRDCLASWDRAGLRTIVVNGRDEIEELEIAYPNTEIVAGDITMAYGRPSIRIDALLDEAARHQPHHILLLNADIELRVASEGLRRLAKEGKDGLVCIHKVNYDSDSDVASAKLYEGGIDGFLFSSKFARLIERSSFAMGQTYWDFWLPWFFIRNEIPTYVVDQPIAYHKSHPTAWSSDAHKRTQAEFVRLNGCVVDHVEITQRSRKLVIPELVMKT